MAVFKCKMCGGTIEFEQGATVGICDSCGTKQTLPTNNDEIIANLHNRANALRLKCEFDKSEEIYNKILEKDPDDAEAHWGIILCKYGIEYVEDPKSGKLVPTCHRTSFEAILADEDYKAAIKNSSGEQQALYQTEAKEIDRIQKDILAIVKNEKPFDVFICYKETDENGSRTPDSVIANDIYYQLTNVGFKVFYAAITLEDKIGQEYEPYIFAALNSAKVMLAIGTKPEYFSAVWVKNEWTRFLKLMKTDKNKILIPCYKGMDAYELPEEFAHLQAQDMGKIGFINDLIRGIKKVVSEPTPKQTIRETVVTESMPGNVSAFLDRGFMALEDGDFEKADDFFEQALNFNAKIPEAYLGKLMAELHVTNKELLSELDEPFDNSSNFQKAVRFGSEKLSRELNEYVSLIKERNELGKLEAVYSKALAIMKDAQSINECRNAAEKFESIPQYKDAAALAEQCRKKEEDIRKDSIYFSAKSRAAGRFIPSCESAIKLFESIPDWKDSKEQIEILKKKIEEIKEIKEAERIKEIETEKKAKKITGIVLAAITVFTLFIILLVNVIIPNIKYSSAVIAAHSGDYLKAYETFRKLNNYKDSEKQAKNTFREYRNWISNEGTAAFPKANIGDIILFGMYEQDNDTENGKEPIEWIVIAKEDNRALLISKYALDAQPYNTSIYKSVSWETCELRKWLNETFLNEAFIANEQSLISESEVSADRNPEYAADPGNSTIDKIFILSISEAEKYFSTEESRQCEATNYAIKNGVYPRSDNNCSYWLRTPGRDNNYAGVISIVGYISCFGDNVKFQKNGVRPAMWVSIE